jgi:hypothetical protein
MSNTVQPDEENLLAPKTEEDGAHDGTEGLPYEDKVSWACLSVATIMLPMLL